MHQVMCGALPPTAIIDGQANAWPFSVFTQKQVFSPRTDKAQPIWIKFCTHLLLYGIHLWADLDRDRRVGGSRPNHNDYVIFVRLRNDLYRVKWDVKPYYTIPMFLRLDALA